MEKILVIEDQENFSSNLAEFLTLEGFEVLVAEDGLKGLHLALALHPDLILCDLQLPKISGFEILQEIRQNLTTAKIPFIFLTASANEDASSQALKMGANSYLIKPIMLSNLLQIIKNYL